MPENGKSWKCLDVWKSKKLSGEKVGKGIFLRIQSYSQMMSKGCPSSPPKRKVFRFHYHSQKVIGSLGF